MATATPPQEDPDTGIAKGGLEPAKRLVQLRQPAIEEVTTLTKPGEYIGHELMSDTFLPVKEPTTEMAEGEFEPAQRHAQMRLQAIEEAKIYVKPGDYIERDLYGRCDPRIKGADADRYGKKEKQVKIFGRKTGIRFSFRKGA